MSGFRVRPNVAFGVLAAAISLVLVACAPTPTPTSAPPAATKPAASPVSPPAVASASPSLAPSPSPGLQPSPAALSPRVKIRLAYIGLVGEAAHFIALDRGYFAAEGLDVELVNSRVTQEQVTLLASGGLEIGMSAVGASLYNANARDIAIQIIGSNTTSDKDHAGGAALVARKQIVDAGEFRTVADLRGKTIAIQSLNSTSQLQIEYALVQAGLKADDVTFVALQFADHIAALAGSRIDYAYTVEPFITLMKGRDVALPVIGSEQLYPLETAAQVVFVSPTFAQRQQEALRRFITAMVRGARDYNRVMFENRGTPQERAAIVDILVRSTDIKEAALYDQMIMPYIDVNSAVSVPYLNVTQNYFIEKGAQQAKVDFSRLVDMQFVDYALRRLGRA